MTQIGRSSARLSVAVPGRTDARIGLSWAAATDIGRRRKLNEDSYVAQSPVFAVADGMGGHAAGDIASGAVVTRLAEFSPADFTDQQAIFGALRAATLDITLAEDDDELGVGTTVSGAALTMQGGEPYWAVFNIGDSRVYLFESGELSQITVDHSVVQELVDAGVISRRDAETHPDSNVITRAVGFNSEPVADFWMLPVRAGLRLLVCSDGLTREVGDEALREQLGAGLEPEETAAALVKAALASGGRDNITTVIVDVIDSPADLELDTTIPRAAGKSH